MKPRVFLVAVVAVIGLCGFAHGDEPSQDKSDKPLSRLEARLQKMLAAQTAVHDDTKALHKAIQGNPDKKPRAEDQRAAMKLAVSEKDILDSATKVIDDLKADGSTQAFLEVVQELHKDIERLVGRLQSGDVGAATQALEQDIGETLKEMIGSHKKR